MAAGRQGLQAGRHCGPDLLCCAGAVPDAGKQVLLCRCALGAGSVCCSQAADQGFACSVCKRGLDGCAEAAGKQPLGGGQHTAEYSAADAVGLPAAGRVEADAAVLAGAACGPAGQRADRGAAAGAAPGRLRRSGYNSQHRWRADRVLGVLDNNT